MRSMFVFALAAFGAACAAPSPGPSSPPQPESVTFTKHTPAKGSAWESTVSSEVDIVFRMAGEKKGHGHFAETSRVRETVLGTSPWTISRKYLVKRTTKTRGDEEETEIDPLEGREVVIEEEKVTEAGKPMPEELRLRVIHGKYGKPKVERFSVAKVLRDRSPMRIGDALDPQILGQTSFLGPSGSFLMEDASYRLTTIRHGPRGPVAVFEVRATFDMLANEVVLRASLAGTATHEVQGTRELDTVLEGVIRCEPGLALQRENVDMSGEGTMRAREHIDVL